MGARIVGVLLGAVAALSVWGPAWGQGCQPAVAESELVKPGTLVMSTNPTLPPMQFVDASGALKGMRIELGEMIARKLCLQPEFVKVEFAAMIPGLAARRWDMIDTGMFFTAERAKIVQLVRYEAQAISISVPRGNPGHVGKIEDLAGKTIGVEQGGFEFQRSRDIAAAIEKAGLPAATVRPFDNFAIAFQALRAGQVDAVVSIDSTAKEYDDRGDFTRAVSGLYPTPIAFGLRSRPLAQAVAGAVAALKKEGSFQALLDKYGVAAWAGDSEVVGPE